VAWTTGNVTNNRRNTTAGIVVNSASSSLFVAGWFLPTTLTAGNSLWSIGSIVGARVAATTSELNFDTDNVTDGQWLTSGLGLTTGQWWFLAWALNSGTAPASGWAMWAGTVDTAPAAVTVTNPTAPVGAFTSNGGISISNRGTGTVAFVGDTGDMVFAHAGASTAGPMRANPAGAFLQVDIDRMYEQLVLPVWRGDPFPPALRDLSVALETTFIPGDLSPALADTQHARFIHSTVVASTPVATMTLSNAPVKSQNRCPVPMQGLNGPLRYVRR
jgi:hypothetical protein